MNTPNHLDDTAISNLVDRGMLPATNAETTLGNQPRKAVAAFIDPELTHADLKARLEMGGADSFSKFADQRRERMLRELASDLADLVASGDMTSEQANEWYSDKADQWN